MLDEFSELIVMHARRRFFCTVVCPRVAFLPPVQRTSTIMPSQHNISGAIRFCVPMVASLALFGCGEAPRAQLDMVNNSGVTYLNHTPPAVDNSAQKGRVDADAQLNLRVALELRDEEALDALIAEQHNPQSPRYKQYISPEEFRERFHPSADQVAKVQQELLAHGIESDVEAHGTVVHARAKVKDAEAYFNTQLYHYESSDGARFHAPAEPITLHKDLGIRAVRGLATQPPPHPNYVLRQDKHWAVAPPTYDAKQIRSAYNIPQAYTGKGQTIALIELDGYDAADITAYAKNNGIREVPTKNILVDGFDGKVHDAGAQVEVTMDIQMINALAPQADAIRVYEDSNAGSGFFDIFNELANPKLGDKYLSKIISCSWGLAEDMTTAADVRAENAIFKQMAAQGQTMFSASGDNGARDDGTNLSVDDPASQPYVVGVGGTTLNAKNGVYSKEKTWTNGGGGVSQYWHIPDWQKGAVTSGSRGSTVRRNVPDVSLNADPETGYEVYVAGQTQIVGGTSCAAPLWAAFLGLADEARAQKGMPALGFLSPTLYALGKQANSSTYFHDISDKSTNGFYPAVKGYDNATGWGSINGAPLLEALSQK
jgi:kumamolisin